MIAAPRGLTTEAGGYFYRALRRDGTVETGVLDAATAADAFATLTTRGLLPVDVRFEVHSRDRRASISTRDLALGLRILADLVESGLPIARSLHTLEGLAPGSWRQALPQVRQSVREGKSLASAFESAPIAIPALVVGITQAGEASGHIGPAIRRAAELMEQSAATRASIRAALAYPMVLAVAGVASVGVLIGIVLPRFTVMLADLDRGLPPATRLLLGVVAAVRGMLLPGVIILVLGAVTWMAWVATEKGRERWHAWLLDLPLIGTVRRSSATARVALSLSMLLESGVPISDAMHHAAKASGDASLERRLLKARVGISTGTSIATALDEADAATPTAVRLVRAGEVSGRLSVMLAHVGKIEHEQSDRIVKSAVRLLEPTLVLTFALIVALVAAALLQAVYSVRPVA